MMSRRTAMQAGKADFSVDAVFDARCIGDSP